MKDKTQADVDLHQAALTEFDAVYEAQWPVRQQALEDRAFYVVSGAQWDGPIGEQFDKKLRLEANKLLLDVVRIFNDYSNNRINVSYLPGDGGTDTDADALSSLYRASESSSTGKEALDTAFQEAVGGGMGAYRLRAVYEDDDSEDSESQLIIKEPIADADVTVYFDLGATRQNKSDAKRCWVLVPMTHEDFEDQYGHDGSSFSTPSGMGFRWVTPEYIYVAEYYKVEDYSEYLHKFIGKTGDIVKVWHKEMDERKEELLATGYTEQSKKKINKKRVRKYIMSGSGIEEDCGYIAGSKIPIIPVYGKRWIIDGVEYFMGHVRPHKDLQRLHNMQLSKIGEIAAMSQAEKPIFYPQEMNPQYSDMWKNDAVENYSHLYRLPLKDMNGNVMPSPVEYTRPPNIPPAMVELINLTSTAMSEMMGSQRAGETIAANSSGKAVELVQASLDMQTWIYVENMAKAKVWGAEVFRDMAKDLFHEKGRKLTGVAASKKNESIEIRKPVYDKKTGDIIETNDFSKGKYTASADIGPSSDSKRSATVRALTGMQQLPQSPEMQEILSAATLMNFEGEGMEGLREFARKKLVALGAAKPTKEDEADAESAAGQQQPDPQAEYLKAAAQEAEAKAEKALSDTVLAQAKAELTRAQTVELTADLAAKDQDRLLAFAQQLEATTGDVRQERVI